MANDGKIDGDFGVMLAAYPRYNELAAKSPLIKKAIDGLNAVIKKINEENAKKVPPGPKLGDATPCVFQVSHALNALGGKHKVGPKSNQRPNTQLGGDYYMGNVRELEGHMIERYGQGEAVKTKERTKETEMKASLSGRRGLLLFRDGPMAANAFGHHTELWDKTSIVQSAGYPGSNGAVMSEPGLWKQPRILFWEATGSSAPPFIVPPWLVGWWQVTDIAGLYFYYFFPDGTVVWTTVRPGQLYCPIARPENSGRFTFAAFRIDVDWGGLPKERFTFMGPASPTVMAGTYVDTAAMPFIATKM